MVARIKDDVVGTAARCLEDGGIVLLPTDTVYGLAVHPRKPDAISRLFSLKGRPRALNLPVMVSSAEDIVDLGGVVNSAARRLLDSAFFPGPITLAVGVAPEKAVAWLQGRIEFAVRMPADDEMLGILKITGPLLVTSANFHAAETYESIGDILGSLNGEPDLVIDGGRRASVPSTLINCRLDPPIVERAGAVSVADISAVLGRSVDSWL